MIEVKHHGCPDCESLGRAAEAGARLSGRSFIEAVSGDEGAQRTHWARYVDVRPRVAWFEWPVSVLHLRYPWMLDRVRRLVVDQARQRYPRNRVTVGVRRNSKYPDTLMVTAYTFDTQEDPS